MTLYRRCPRCGGDGDEPGGPYNTACADCRGRGQVAGRPDSWPPAGAILQRIGELETFEVLEDLSYDRLHLRSEWSGGAVQVDPEEFLGAGHWAVVSLPPDEDARVPAIH